jgi:hypothetical protein
VVAEGAGAGAAVAGETAAEGASAAAGGATIAGIGIFVAILFYSKPIAVGPGEWAGPPVASATSMPTTTAVPITTTIPIARRYPTQTCDDDELDRLEGEKDKLCKPKGGYAASCNRKKVDVTLIRCSAILLGIQQRQICKARRQLIQDKCFGGKPDAGHQTAIDQEQNGIDQCEALKLINCAKGHPMAGL